MKTGQWSHKTFISKGEKKTENQDQLNTDSVVIKKSELKNIY